MAYTPPDSSSANLIFSESYSIPSSTAADLIIGEVTGTAESFYQIWTDSDYIYAATSEGLKIYSVSLETEFATVTYSGGINTVWANDDKVFVGTSADSVKYLNKTCISGTELITCLNDLSDLTYYSTLTAENIIYIHGYEDTIICATISGVDVVKLDPQSYRSHTTISGINKCFMASDGGFYYMSSTILYGMDSNLTDWISPDHTYNTLFYEQTLNDFFVDSDNIYVATSSGIYVIDRYNDTYDVYYIE